MDVPYATAQKSSTPPAARACTLPNGFPKRSHQRCRIRHARAWVKVSVSKKGSWRAEHSHLPPAGTSTSQSQDPTRSEAVAHFGRRVRRASRLVAVLCSSRCIIAVVFAGVPRRISRAVGHLASRSIQDNVLRQKSIAEASHGPGYGADEMRRLSVRAMNN